ncbi:type III secretion system needle length determinant [Aeromonas jandaei]|uniref:type III secretion system needle length determinant n=1 Tax=Aeromonas jandaei TaxID=650 RepID=UPI001BB551E2|nr:type III secretion system needle length determinant [Aeromonas jandaei]QTL94460.1 Flagellar hook-length control protein FliK [Aeromonas jandaei]
MNRLTAPRAEPRVADEQQGLPREPLKADLAQQQRFEQAMRLESVQQKRARDHKALTGNPIGKRDEHRRTKPDAPLAGNKAADKEKELAERRLTRPAPRSKTQHDKLEGHERQESQTLPATLPLIREGMQAPTAQQGRETAPAALAWMLPRDVAGGRESFNATEPETKDCVDGHTADQPLAMSNTVFTKQQQSELSTESSPLANSYTLPVADYPNVQERAEEQAAHQLLAMPNEPLTSRKQGELPIEHHPLATSDIRPVAAAPSTQERVDAHPVDLPLAMPNEALIRRALSEQPMESSHLTDSHMLQEQSELAARFEVGERLQIADEPTEQLPATSEKEPLAQESFASSANRVPPLAATPGDLLLARVAPRVDHHELGQLLSRLAVDIHLELGRPERPPMLQLTLPALGELAIRIEHHQGSLQVEMLASEQGSQLLNQGRGELIDRLQRLYPGERIAFDLFTRGDSEQGSRQKRSIYDEWDADA